MSSFANDGSDANSANVVAQTTPAAPGAKAKAKSGPGNTPRGSPRKASSSGSSKGSRGKNGWNFQTCFYNLLELKVF